MHYWHKQLNKYNTYAIVEHVFKESYLEVHHIFGGELFFLSDTFKEDCKTIE